MKVIFFDIDGVLNCESTPNPRDFPYIADKRLLRRFRTLLKNTGAKAVMASTWRVDPVGLCAARYFGIPFFDVLPDRPKRPRREEVLLWLKKHPRVRCYAVIDDEDDELDDLPLFQPSARKGLTPEIARGVARYLSGKTDDTMRASAIKRLAENAAGLFHRSKD
jgi:hypothetical protein